MCNDDNKYVFSCCRTHNNYIEIFTLKIKEMNKKIKELYDKKSKEYVLELKKQKTAKTDYKKINTDLIDSLKSLGLLKIEIYDSVKIIDNKNEYVFKIVEKSLRMKKTPIMNRSRGWGYHPFDIYDDMIMKKITEDEEIIWEGGKTPESEKVKDYLELLKSDIISNGPISKLIKTYLTEGIKTRSKLNKIVCNYTERQVSSDFWDELNELIPKDIKTLEPVEGLFNIRVRNEKWLKMTFLKETPKQLHFSFYKKMKNGDEKTITKREDKEYFKISDFIELVTPFHDLTYSG